MAREREITCGDHTFTTRANPRVFVRCPACGTGHRAPAIADGWKGPEAEDGSHEAVGDVADLVGELLPPPASTVVKITKVAHSTARRAEKAAGTRKKATKATKKAAPPPTRAQQAGRRGGLAPKRASFLRRVGR